MAILILISFSSIAAADGEKTEAPDANTEAAVTVEAVVPTSELIVINLNEKLNTTGMPEDIRQQFEEAISYPEGADNAEDKEIVVVCYSYDDDGYVHVKCTTSSNEYFNTHVVSNMEKIRLRDGNVTVGKQYYAKFSFKRL